MKISRFLLTLAICGAGAIHANAQTTQLTSGHPGSPIVLASQFDDELSFSDDVPEVAEDFQFQKPAQPVIDVPSVSDALEAASPSDAIPVGRSVLDNGPIAPEPQSLPVATHGQGYAPQPSQNVMAGVTHVQDGAVMWNAGPQQLSPVGRVLLRTECNAGQLWNNYPAERAAECAAMWNCLNKSRGCGCNQCASQCSGCAPTGCAAPQRGCMLNRYRHQSAPAACDSCDSCDGLAVVPTTGTVARTVAVEAPAPVAQPVGNAAYGPDIRSLPKPPQTPVQTTSRPKYNTASAQYRVMR